QPAFINQEVVKALFTQGQEDSKQKDRMIMNLPLRLRIELCVSVAVLICSGCVRRALLNQPPQGFMSLFNVSDLEGW
ncbi:MAG: hypothetical protein ACYS6I_06325, partial [Planctomycetota bacterium]